MYCSKCGKELPNDSNFCINCGAKAIPELTDKTSGLIASDDGIRLELKKYKQHKKILCLECGYEGLVGISKEKIKPLWKRLSLEIVAALVVGYISLTRSYFGISSLFIWLVLFPLMVLLYTYLGRCYMVCPKCKSKLK